MGALANLRKRNTRIQESYDAARSARAVDKSPKVRVDKRTKSDDMVRSFMRDARKANPAPSRTPAQRLEKPRGLRAAPTGPTYSQQRTKQLEQSVLQQTEARRKKNAALKRRQARALQALSN